MFLTNRYANPITLIEEPDKAMGVDAFYACVKVLSERVALKPIGIYQRRGEATNELRDYDQFDLLTKNPNEYVTAFNWKRQIVIDYLLFGNGIAIIERDSRDRPVSYVNERNVLPFVDENRLYYYNRDTDRIHLPRDVIHLADLSENAIWGISKVSQHKKTLGKTQAAQDYVNNVYSNGLFMGGVIEYPDDMDIPLSKKIELRETFKDTYGGLANAGQVGIIDLGGKFKSFDNTMPLSDFEYIQSEHMTIEAVCRIMGVPPASIFHYYKSNYNSLEHQEMALEKQGVLPIITQFEEELNTKIFRKRESKTHFVEFKDNAVMRADLAAQQEYLTNMVTKGLMSRNEARALKNLPPVEYGDEIMIEANNMAPLSMIYKMVKETSNGEA